MNRKKLFLILPAFWASAFDISITILGQAKEYWRGDLLKYNEGNPIGQLAMSSHVSGIFIISIAWLIIIAVLGYYLPTFWARLFLIFVFISHCWGSSTWLSGKFGFWYVMIFMVFNSILFFYSDQFSGITNFKSPFTNQKD